MDSGLVILLMWLPVSIVLGCSMHKLFPEFVEKLYYLEDRCNEWIDKICSAIGINLCDDEEEFEEKSFESFKRW